MSVDECRTKERAIADAAVKRSGYNSGGRLKQEEASDEAKDKRMVKKAVHQHEKHDHKGQKPTDLKLKGGGEVKGKMAEKRLDKRARGGALTEPMPEKAHGDGGKKAAGKGKHGPNINIILPQAAEAEKKQAAAAGMQVGAKMGADAARGAGGPPMGAAPPGGAPPAPRPMPAPGGAPGGMPPGAGGPPMRPNMPPPGQPPMRRGGRLHEKKGGGIC
jgi:hypothetical protein